MLRLRKKTLMCWKVILVRKFFHVVSHVTVVLEIIINALKQ